MCTGKLSARDAARRTMEWEHAVYYAMNTLFFPAVVIAVELLRWINS